MIKYEFDAIGTRWQIDIEEELSKSAEDNLLSKVKTRIDSFDRVYSRFREDSIVTEMSRQSGKFTLPKDSDKMINEYKRMYDATGGLVTPLIGKVMEDSGYDAKYSLVPKKMVEPRTWDETMEWNSPDLFMKTPTLLDFGAGGKGYLVDIVGELLEEEGIRSYCVDAGGDMRHRSRTDNVLRVGLEHPDNPEKVIGVLNLKNGSLCGSSGNRRKWDKFHHIIDPKKLSSPQDVLAVWAVAKSTLIADLITTGIFFSHPEKLSHDFEFEYLVIYSDHRIEKSTGFEAELFV